MSDCVSLQQLLDLESIGGLSRLRRLKLGGCSALQELPASFAQLSSLRYVRLPASKSGGKADLAKAARRMLPAGCKVKLG
jgi:hypothetical protein